MSDAPNFANIFAQEAPTEINYPEPVPVGTYIARVGIPTYDKSSKKGTPYVQFPLTLIEACEDVDPDELESMGGLEGKQVRATFYINEGEEPWRLTEFHTHCGLDITQPGSLATRNDAVVNADVIIYIKHRIVNERPIAEFAKSVAM